jgi:hypothetical protein
MALTETEATETNGHPSPLDPAETVTTEVVTLPESIAVGASPRLTPNELRFLKVSTGRTLSDLFADEADAMQSMVWLKLRRAGYAVSWDAAGDVEAIMGDAAVDPTNSGPSPTSPLSVATGG